MKLFSIHYADNLKEIEYNHKKFCEVNNFEYNKIIIPNITAAKYAFILQKMQKNIGENIIFIDSNSYFKNFIFDLTINKSIFIQKIESALDNFLFLNSNKDTIEIIENIYKNVKKQTFTKETSPTISIEFPENIYQKYPFKNNNIYTNIDIGFHNEDVTKYNDTLVFHINSRFPELRGIYFANAFLKAKKFNFITNDNKFDLIKPNQRNALVMLYTKEIKDYAVACEKNLTNYCKRNNLTLYVYRENPEEFSAASGSWCKPRLLLNHIEDHDNIIWIDSDILITKNFKFSFEEEIGVYHDPASWLFNSGFMWFKNTEKNKLLLEKVLEQIKNLPDISGVYTNGGDQKIFINVIKSEYPDIMIGSNFLINSFPTYPIQIDPTKHSAMIHFMGFSKSLRENVMKGFCELIEESWEDLCIGN